MPIRSELGVWKGRMVAQDVQSGGNGENKSLEVLKRRVSGSPDVGGREQAEYIFSRLGKLPELVMSAVD